MAESTLPKEDSRPLTGSLSWLGALPTNSQSALLFGAHINHGDDVDCLIRPSPNFLDDVVTHPSTAAPTVSALGERGMDRLYSDSTCPPTINTENKETAMVDWINPVVPSCPMPPPKPRHYDDEDYISHRHLAYPHVHQPLKAMEPRTLRRVRERLLAVRAAFRHADDFHTHNLAPSDTQTEMSNNTGDQPHSITARTASFNENPAQEPEIDSASSLIQISDTATGGEANHLLDPSSPSLAERACMVGQAVKSRRYEADSWSVPQLACDHLPESVVHPRPNSIVLSATLPFKNEWQNDSQESVPSSCSARSIRSIASVNEERRDCLPNIGLRNRRRRRSRGKLSISAFQPSLTKLSEEGSPLSSSTASSSLSVQLTDGESSNVHGQSCPRSSLHIEPFPEHGEAADHVTTNISNIAQVSDLMRSLSDFPHGSSESLQQTPIAIDPVGSAATGLMEAESLSHGTSSETNSCHELDEGDAQDGSLKAFSVTKSHLQRSVGPCSWNVPDATWVQTPTGFAEDSESQLSPMPVANRSIPTTSVRDQSPLPVDGDSMDLDPGLAPLARPESVSTCDEATVANGDQLDIDIGPPVDTHHSVGWHRSSQLTVRTLTGVELKQLNWWKRQLRSHSSTLVTSDVPEASEPQDTPIALDKDAVEVESHRYFELPGTRRRRRLLWAGFRASQRRWESLEQAAAAAQFNARLRQCATAGGNLDSLHARDGIHKARKQSSRSSIVPSPQPVAAHPSQCSTTFASDEFRPRRGSISLPELLDSHDGLHLTAGLFGQNEGMGKESQLAARHLIRPDGSLLEHVPPVFVELDILNCCQSTNAAGGEELGSVLGSHLSHKMSSPCTTSPQPSWPRPDADNHLSSPGFARLKWSWLEAARWIRYEQDFDPVTGAFGQAHSPPLTFHAVVECRRYLEQGAIVLQPDPKTAITDHPARFCSRLCRDRARLLAEIDGAMLALCSDCGASVNEVSLIRHVLTLRHQHVCDLRHHHHAASCLSCAGLMTAAHVHGEHHSGFETTQHPSHTTASFLPSFFSRSRRKSTLTQTSTSADLRNTTGCRSNNKKRTTSVPIMDSRLTDVERGLLSAAHPSLVSPSSVGETNMAQRAVSALRRAFTPTNAPRVVHSPNDIATGDHSKKKSTDRSVAFGLPESYRERSTTGQQPRTVTPDSAGRLSVTTTAPTTPAEVTKHLSDLAGRLKSSTEIVSVQVGILPGLRRPMLAFVRLQHALFAPGLTELRDSHPIRFLVLFLGPERHHLDYGEVGRCIATMMVDKAFRRTAYTAVCREDLLDGLRTFLDTTIVLPMLSDITPKSLLAMHDQLRLFRRHHRPGSARARRNSGMQTVKPKRSRARLEDKKLSDGLGLTPAQPVSTETAFSTEDRIVIMEREPHGAVTSDTAQALSSAAASTAVPVVIVTPPPLQDCVAAVRVKQELSRSLDHRQATSDREPTVPLLQASAGFRNGDDGASHLSFTSHTTSVGSHSPNQNRKRQSAAPKPPCTSSVRSSPCALAPSGTRAWSRGCCPDPCCPPWCQFGVALCTDLHAYRDRFWSDLTDPFRPSSRTADLSLMLATVVFLYFVVLAPAVTFGALMVSNVSPTFTIPLCIFASGASQCLFSLLGGQPLLIVGITGPMLIIETCIKLVCDVNQAPLGLMRLLVAIYTSLFGLLAVFSNAGWLALRVRRSLEEVFNFFVSFYFIFKAFKSLFQAILHTEPPKSDEANEPKMNVSFPFPLNYSGTESLNSQKLEFITGDQEKTQFDSNQQSQQAGAIVALLIAILMFSVCSWLQSIKRGRYFRRTVRNLFGYFNVPIGLFCAVCVNQILFGEIAVPTVQMPLTESLDLSHLIAPPFRLWSLADSTQRSNQSETSLVDPSSHGLAALMAVCLLPAITTETLLSGITVAKSERRLRKPGLFSLDLVVTTCVMPLVSGLFGWPFLSPAAVRSNTHVIALTKWNTRTPPGVPHRIVGCVEQRWTGLVIGLLVALSVTLESRLFALVPMGALYGMFLYMGAMGLRDLVVVRRLCALLKRRKHWKDREYLRHLPPSTLALFVGVQLGFIVLLLAMNWVTEFARVGATSLVFPFILLLYALTRECLLPRCGLLRPYLEQMDRLHKLRLPRPQQSGLCCTTTAMQRGHCSSSNDEDDDPFIVADTSPRTSFGSQGKLSRNPSTVTGNHEEVGKDAKSVWLGVLRRSVRTRRESRALKRVHISSSSLSSCALTGCGWTASSGLDRLNEVESLPNKDRVVSATCEDSGHLVPSRSWHRFQRKFSGLFFHSLGDSALGGNRGMLDGEPSVQHVTGGRSEPLAAGSDKDSPLLLLRAHSRDMNHDQQVLEDDDPEMDRASSSSLSNLEYSESELESRMDNPYWLD